MDIDIQLKIDLEIPFPTNRLAEIAYDVLRVDGEPKRSGVTKKLLVKDNILHAHFEAELARQLRVSVNGFFDKIDLLTETIDTIGAPVSKVYSHY